MIQQSKDCLPLRSGCRSKCRRRADVRSILERVAPGCIVLPPTAEWRKLVRNLDVRIAYPDYVIEENAVRAYASLLACLGAFVAKTGMCVHYPARTIVDREGEVKCGSFRQMTGG